jgi:uncharacterized protein (TIGR03435 family)
MRGLKLATGLALYTWASLGQTPAPGLVRFEVASVKPSPPIPMAAVQAGKAHVGMRVDPSMVDIGYLSLQDLIRYAYRMQPHQPLIGPEWMATLHFDIAAKPPENALKKVPEMVQALLADRFALETHHESREMAVYTLVVADQGLRLKKALAEEDPPEPAPTGGDANQTPTNGRRRGIQFVHAPDGSLHIHCEKMNLYNLASILTQFVDRPVVDGSNVEGDYQIDFAVSREEMANMSRRNGAMVMMPPGMAEMGHAGGDPNRVEVTTSLFTGLKSVGLRLRSQKAPVDVLVVDRLERTPTAN